MSFQLIALNHNIKEKVRAEVRSIIEESEGRIGVAELQKMPYLEQCLKETMRLHPAVGVIARNTSDYLKLSNYQSDFQIYFQRLLDEFILFSNHFNTMYYF